MVLKIDHVSFSCEKGQENSANVTPIYERVFFETDLPNISCKRELLKNHADTHNIIMYHAGESYIPIEVTQYPSVKNVNNDISLNQRAIEWKVKSIKESMGYFETVGFKCIDETNTYAIMKLKPFLDKEPIEISLLETEQISAEGFLDVFGYSSLGLLVDNVEMELNKFAARNFVTTEVNSLEVNGKKMNVAFTKGPSNEIIELIAVCV